jgi:rhodanese-related sulfurtransferase
MTTESRALNVSMSVAELQADIAGAHPPVVLDVRRQPTFLEASSMVAGALRRRPEAVAHWSRSLPRDEAFVVYCAHGREVGRDAAMALRERGMAARYLEGGIEAWHAAGGALDTKPKGGTTRWVTRERPKIDRIACPWLIARFVDAEAEFLYVPGPDVLSVAERTGAIPYDVPGVHFSHVAEHCSFDAFVGHYRLRDPALAAHALIVRAADTGRLELAHEAPCLAAISLGLSRHFDDDHHMLGHGMVMYDALYRWCQEGKDEVRTWNLHASSMRGGAAAA